ncbi:uncharacterized protein LOC127451974 isoform X2 [Myxocyprinus asiaticus]|uniref:uncharacterized protein LOC127451974 isoform X2 n=1 Tax=Myxocyprinus asiaticus TaxID=70543 RepID=UPI00222295AC|nr:uncharacterized protein LOC127451974 isoform X2 [Myxocyprinus asiaticus]
MIIFSSQLKLDLFMLIFMAAILNISDGFIVKGPSRPLVVPLGGSVVLPCFVDKPLLTEGLKVEWRRSDSDTPVHLYQDGESKPEVQQQDYHDRAHFFTDQIQHGNFSLLLNNVRVEDEGTYRCKVYSELDSGETVVEIKHVERLIVSGSRLSISAYVGDDVNLNCSVDSHITPEEIEEVSWKKINKDGDILVLLFQNKEIKPESSYERYMDRVEFFTDEIPKGNFSLRLKSVRTEDKGVYMCQVFAGDFSANTTVVLEELGFSFLHITLLFLCVAASGSALLFLCVVYCQHKNKGFVVKGLSDSLFVPLGGSVVLPCYVDKSLPTKGLKVEWRRSDSETLVHLYQDGESRPETRQQDYHDRAHFFTNEIQHGNCSLLLKNVTAKDEGEYRCKVYSEQNCVFSVNTHLEPRFTVEPLFHPFFPLGGSVVLPCYTDKTFLKEDLRVEWRKLDSDTLVHLYQDGERRRNIQKQEYRDRAFFFTDQIQHGNFSLLLNNVTAEDEGKYKCTINSKRGLEHLTITNVVLENLKVEWKGTDSKTLVLYPDVEREPGDQQQDYHDGANFFTDEIKHGNFSLQLKNVSAKDKGIYRCEVQSGQDSEFSITTKLSLRPVERFIRLQLCLVFCPNFIMFLAFVLWGVSEGFLNETVTCCTLYMLRPLMLLWAAPFAKKLPGNIKKWISNYSFDAEYVVFTIIVYSVFFKYDWDKIRNYSELDRALVTFFFGFMLLLCAIVIVYIFHRVLGNTRKRIHAIFRVVAVLSYEVLPSLQFIFLFYAFGADKGSFFIAGVLPLFVTLRRHNWDIVCGLRIGCSSLVMRSLWLVFTLVMNAVMVYFFIQALENENDCFGWVCTIEFLQVLWAVMDFNWSFNYPGFPRSVTVYLIGSVGVVLVNSLVMMTELILKTTNGERAVGDLRMIVFPSECLFAIPLLILQVFAPWIFNKECLKSCQNAAGSDETPHIGSHQSPNTERLLQTEGQKAGWSEKTENAAGSDETTGSDQNTVEMNSLLETQDQEAGKTHRRNSF